VSWSAKRETDIHMGGSTGIQRGRTLEEAFRRYEREVPVHKQRKRLEILRTAAL